MKRRIWTRAAGLAAVAALVAVPAAMAAYASPKLEVTRTRPAWSSRRRSSANDDPTASVAIYAPAGTQLTTTQAPGTVLGPVRAIVKALDLAGADCRSRANSSSPRRARSAGGQRRRASDRRHAARNLGDGADGGRPDANGPDVSPRHDRDEGRSRPGATSSDLPASSGRAARDTRPRDLRREGVQRRAHDQRRLQPHREPEHGSRRGCRTHPPRRAQPDRHGRSPAAIAPGAVTLTARTSGAGPGVTGRRDAGWAGTSRGTVTISQRHRERQAHDGRRVRGSGRTGGSRTRSAAGTFFRATRDRAHRGLHLPVCTQIRPRIGPGPVREPDLERVQRAEQGRPQAEVATTPHGAGVQPAPSRCASERVSVQSRTIRKR